jgi:hypothetical protein
LSIVWTVHFSTQTKNIKLDVKYIFQMYLIKFKTIIYSKVFLINLINSLGVTSLGGTLSQLKVWGHCQLYGSLRGVCRLSPHI